MCVVQKRANAIVSRKASTGDMHMRVGAWSILARCWWLFQRFAGVPCIENGKSKQRAQECGGVQTFGSAYLSRRCKGKELAEKSGWNVPCKGG